VDKKADRNSSLQMVLDLLSFYIVSRLRIVPFMSSYKTWEIHG
jgi:hypothetical protein